MKTLGCLHWFRAVLTIGSAVTLALLSSAAITKAQGRLTLTPETVNFGAVAIGQSEAADVTIRNSGNCKLVFSKETLEGVEFSLSGFALPLTLEAGEAVTITVQFYPRSFGKASGSVALESDAANGNVYVPLSGTGIANGAEETGGSAGAVTPAFVGVNAEPAEVAVSGTNARVAAMPAVTSVELNSSVAEATGGTESSVAGRTTARMNATETASVKIEATPSSAVFEDVPVGTSDTQTIKLTNAGSTSAVISAVSTQGTGFATSGLTAPKTVAVDGTVTFNVKFSPTSTATEAGMLKLTVSGTSVTIPLVGHAVADTRVLAATPTSANFGKIAVESTPSEKVSLKNDGNSNVVVSSVSTSAKGFSVSGVGSGTTIEPGQTAVLTIEFAPKSTGSITGSVNIVSDATNGSTITIPVSGDGITAPTTTAESVLLNWEASGSAGVVGYNVYRASASGGPYTKLDGSPVGATAYTDDTVKSGDYYYVVTSVGSNGTESGYSNQAVVDVP